MYLRMGFRLVIVSLIVLLARSQAMEAEKKDVISIEKKSVVLVVDDNPICCNVLKKLVSQHIPIVLTAENGQKALEICKKSNARPYFS